MRLNNTIKHLITLWFLCSLFLSFDNIVHAAQPAEPIDPQLAKQHITDILSRPAFETFREKRTLVYKGDFAEKSFVPTENSASLEGIFTRATLELLAQIFELLLWILLAALIIFLVYYAPRWFKKSWRLSLPAHFTVPPPVIRNDLAQESLPDEIAQQAWLLWQQNQPIIAISLLYRGALNRLIEQQNLPIEISTSEKECLQLLIQQQLPSFFIEFFGELIEIWQKMIYAKQFPTDRTVQHLCERWKHCFDFPYPST